MKRVKPPWTYRYIYGDTSSIMERYGTLAFFKASDLLYLVEKLLRMAP